MSIDIYNGICRKLVLSPFSNLNRKGNFVPHQSPVQAFDKVSLKHIRRVKFILLVDKRGIDLHCEQSTQTVLELVPAIHWRLFPKIELYVLSIATSTSILQIISALAWVSGGWIQDYFGPFDSYSTWRECDKIRRKCENVGDITDRFRGKECLQIYIVLGRSGILNIKV